MSHEIMKVTEFIAEAEKDLGLDGRYSYSRVDRVGDEEISVELSREEVLEKALASLEGFSVESRDGDIVTLRSEMNYIVRFRLLSSVGGATLWVVTSVADVRREPSHSSELMTQLIMGETAVPLKREGDWYLVRLPDGYHGWVRSWYVREVDRSEVEAYRERVNCTVKANVGYVRSSPDDGSLPVSDVVSGTLLSAVDETRGFRLVVLPGGKKGYMRASDLGERTRGFEPDRGRLTRRAEGFIGIPYIWGGTSAKGFDCSGLVKRVFSEEGIELPRDTDRQSQVGKIITSEAIGEAEPGDLLFFGEGDTISHVAIYIGTARFLHAYGEVRINSLREEDPLYDERLAEILQFGRRILP